MNQLINEWKESFNEAVASIENYIKPQTNDDINTIKFRTIAKWLLENEHSPYDYMSLGHQNFKANPYNTDFALSMLHHALLDDGDVAFVTFKVDGETQRVFMMFADMDDEHFRVLCKQENHTMIVSLIDRRKAELDLMYTMQKNNPEQTLSSLSLFEDLDSDFNLKFNFNTHRDPLLFIREFETLQIDKAEKNKTVNEQMAKFRKGKI